MADIGDRCPGHGLPTAGDAIIRVGAPVHVNQPRGGLDQPALGGVYKLAALRDASGAWQDKIKLSEQPIKISNPGVQQVRRYHVDGEIVADTIYDVSQGITSASVMNDIEDPLRKRSIPAGAEHDAIARWLGFATVSTVILWMPQALIFATRSMIADNPFTWMREHIEIVPQAALSGIVIAATSAAQVQVAFEAARRRDAMAPSAARAPRWLSRLSSTAAMPS